MGSSLSLPSLVSPSEWEAGQDSDGSVLLLSGHPHSWFQIPCIKFLKVSLVAALRLPGAPTSAYDFGAGRSGSWPVIPLSISGMLDACPPPNPHPHPHTPRGPTATLSSSRGCTPSLQVLEQEMCSLTYPGSPAGMSLSAQGPPVLPRCLPPPANPSLEPCSPAEQ